MLNKIIDFRSSVDGFLIPFEEGKALASMDHPEQEARRWIDHHKYYLQLKFPIVVLGIGAGIHLQYLLQETDAPIYVVDTRPALIAWASTIFKKTNLQFFSVEKADDITQHFFFEEQLGYMLPLVFSPGAGHSEGIFKSIHEHLLGRSDRVWQMRDLPLDIPRHYREWIKVNEPNNLSLEQRILEEVLA